MEVEDFRHLKSRVKDIESLGDRFKFMVEKTEFKLDRIKEFERHLQALQGAHYVRVWEPLQLAALGDTPLYPPDSDGHPLPHGYLVIANALAPTLRDLFGAR